MKKTGFWRGFGLGLILAVAVIGLSVSALAATSSRTIQVEDGIRISLNGATFVPRDVNGKEVSVFLYNGTTYVPLRAISEAMGMDVSYDSASKTVILVTADKSAAQQGSSTSSYISAERAKEIALADAGIQAADAVFLRAQLDWDDGRAEYEVEFYSGNVEYDYDIDAVTGAIRSSDRDLENFRIPTSGNSQVNQGTSGGSSSGTTISKDRAQQIALAEVPSGTTVIKCHLDWDDGRQVYEVELRNGRTEYDFEIDAQTGSIISRDVDYDD